MDRGRQAGPELDAVVMPQVRGQPSAAIAVHPGLQPGNFVRRLASVKHWSLTILQTKMIKIGERLVRHAWSLVFQLAEMLVARAVLARMLERISRPRLAPGVTDLGDGKKGDDFGAV
jgi:hypothetical protein